MRIYVIRHGQSEANLVVAHAGWNQVPLTEKGVAQAKAVIFFILVAVLALSQLYATRSKEVQQ